MEFLMHEAIKEILKVSILGPVLIAVAWYVWKLHKELKEVQDGRTADAKAVVDKLLTLNDRWNTTVSDQVRVVETVESTLKDVKDTLKDTMRALEDRRH